MDRPERQAPDGGREGVIPGHMDLAEQAYKFFVFISRLAKLCQSAFLPGLSSFTIWPVFFRISILPFPYFPGNNASISNSRRPFPANNQRRAFHALHPVPEIQIFHGINQHKSILFIKRHILEKRLQEKAENDILNAKHYF